MLCISTANATRSMSIPYIDTYNSLYADASTDATGLTDLGLNGYYHNTYGEYAYSYQGSATTLVEGSTITVSGTSTIDYWLSSDQTGGMWKKDVSTITLTADDVAKLAQTDYTFWMAAWFGTITKVTITLPDGTVVGEGGNTGGGTTTDPEEDETDTTPYEKDRTNAFGYAFTNAQLKNYPQLTDVPTVYLNVYAPDSYETGTYANNDIKTGTPQTLAANYQLAANTKITEKKYNWYYQTQIIVRDDNGKMKERNELTTVRARGNSTWRWSDKKPLRLKFPSKTRFLATSADDKTSTNAKSWTLLANSFDKSMLRNGLTHELVDYINKVDNANNLPFNPACQYVDLVVNGEYWGTYQISDQVQVGPGRVDVDADNGWFVEYTVNNNGFVEEPFLKIGSSYVNIKNPEDPNIVDGDPNSTTQLADNQATTNPIYNELKTMLNNLNTGIKGIVVAEKYASSDWMQYIDTRSLVDWFIAMDVTGNYDGCIANDYLYKDVTDKKLKVGPLWDLDLGFGNKQEAKNHFYTAQGQGITYSIQAMLKDPYFVKKLYERWQQIYNNGALTTYLNDKVTALSSTLAQTQAKNYEKWSLGTSNLGKTYSTYQAAVNDVVAFNNAHIPWLETEYKSLYDSMGCADLEDIVDEPDEETGGEEGGGDSSFNPTSTFEFTSAIGSHNIPASAFSSKATKVQVTFTVPNESFWGFYGYNGSQWDAKSFNSVNNTITITIDDATDISTIAQNGITFELQNTNSQTISSAKLTVTVVNTMPNSGGTTPETPTETFEQLTDLPTMYLQIYKLNADGTSDKTQTEAITTSGGAYHTARIVIVDENGTIKERDEETEIRGRGNTTWGSGYGKYPYRLKFPNKTKLLSYLDEDGVTVINNYANAKSWTLLANKGDYSLIRNALTAELGKYMSMPFVPAYKFVDLVVNGNYAGTYQISDQIQVAKDRVNVNSDTGWFLSANRGSQSYEEDPYFTAGGATFNIKNPEATVATATGETEDPKYAAMKAWMTEAMNNASKPEIANYFDMESLANYIIGIDITGDPDGAVDNFYMYREDDPSSKMKFGPMWDYDLAYGNAGAANRDYATMHFFEGNGEYGWMSKLKQIYNTPELIKPLWKRWKEVYGEYDSATGQSTLTKYLLAKVDALDAIIAQSQAKNFEAGKAGSVAGSNTYSTHEAAIAALKAWIPEHIEWLNTTYKADYKEITGLDPDAECSHTYTGGKYTSNGDGSYSRECDVCGMPEEDGTKFYKYTTYANGTTTETFNASKTWATDNAPTNPNALVIVEYGSDITGKNIVVVDNKGKYTCANFELTDGYSFYSPIKFTATTATYTRNVSNDWGTICLPYKVQTVKADDATYYQLKNVGKDNSTLVFEVATSSGAYTPLVFKRKSGSSITVNATEVTVKPTTEDKTNSTVADWTLIGTMEQKQFTNVASELASGEQLYYIAQNKFWHTTSSYTNNPFRAYFIYNPTDPANAAKSFSIGVDDDSATNIDGISNDALAVFVDNGSITMSSGKNTAVRIYTTSGTLVTNTSVGAGESKTINLPTGLYIVNGTKVTVK